MADVPAVSSDDALLSNVPGIDDDTPGDDTPKKDDDPGTVAPIPGDDITGKGDDTVPGTPPTRGPNDLVDAQGVVIAKGGAERRLYEQSQRVQTENSSLKGRVTELEGKLQAVTDAGAIGTQEGLSPEEVTSGLQLAAAYKQSPIETIKFLLTQAQAAGHNIDNIGAGTDVGAIKKMFEDVMQPFNEDRQRQLDTQTARDEADKVYNEFITRHPDAVVHQDAIAQLLERDVTLNPEAAFLKLQLFYVQKKLDWTKSLTTLTKELKAGGAKTQTTLPAGGINPADVTDTAQVASVDTSLDDIIRDSMRDAGVTS